MPKEVRPWRVHDRPAGHPPPEAQAELGVTRRWVMVERSPCIQEGSLEGVPSAQQPQSGPSRRVVYPIAPCTEPEPGSGWPMAAEVQLGTGEPLPQKRLPPCCCACPQPSPSWGHLWAGVPQAQAPCVSAPRPVHRPEPFRDGPHKLPAGQGPWPWVDPWA